ncbi:hypothetical protein [Bradyrhizobium genosp. P]|uniref:hypothetical protein n=1 Tax=Bradyrhizobium genosp. P TaxID=83641 RepID=UPI003CF51255
MTIEKFAGETPNQIGLHRKIALADKQRRRYPKGPLMARLRVSELERFFVHAYGGRSLPDDDAGRADLRLMADHLAQIDPNRIWIWAADWLPEVEGAELQALIARAGIGLRWKADPLARELGLTDATRTQLKIRTIGAVDFTKAQREKRRRKKDKLNAAARRAAAGATPRAQSAAATKPWIAEGISESTYYRRKKAKLEAGDSKTSAIPLSASPPTKHSHEASGSTTDQGEAHSRETSKPIGKPLPSSIHVDRPCDETGRGQIADPGDALIDDVDVDDAASGCGSMMLRVFHGAYYQSLGLPRSPALNAYLAELDDMIETMRERDAERKAVMIRAGHRARSPHVRRLGGVRPRTCLCEADD